MKFRNLSLAFGALLCLATTSVQAAQTETPFTLSTRYNLKGQIVGTIAPDPDGPSGVLKYPAMRNTYDSRGLLTKVEQGELSAWLDETVAPSDWGSSASFTVHITKEFEYDDYGFKVLGRLRGNDGSIEALVQYSYDASNLVKCKAVRMNRTAFVAPPSDACALGAQGPDGPDRISKFTYGAYDQVATEVRALGVSGEQQTYQNNEYEGRLLRYQTDANGNRSEFRYDGYGRLVRRIFPSATPGGGVNNSDYVEYTYELNGNLKTERKRNGALITYTYDGNNRPIVKDISDNANSPDTYYDYDLRGLVLHSFYSSDTGQGESNTYNGFGDQMTRTTNMGGTSRTLSYAYDENSNRTRITHPDGYFFETAYDNLDRPSGLGESAAPNPTAAVNSLATLVFGTDSKLSTLGRANGVTTTLTRDNAERLDSIIQNAAGTNDDLTNVFTYNAAAQITELVQSNPQYNYTEAVNRTGTYAPNGLNQIKSINTQNFSYDLMGNLTNDGELTLSYDMENRLVSASGTVNSVSVNATMTWDPLGRLSRLTVAGTTTEFLYDGEALVAEYVSGAMTMRYVHGGKGDQPLLQYSGAAVSASARRFLLTDHLGSVIAIANNSGTVVNRLKYDSFGIPASGNVGRFQFTGQTLIKELGIYYYKARMYSPRLGRFLQTDPIYYKDDMNLYAYTGGDPMNKIDSTGLAGALCFAMTNGIGTVCAGPAFNMDGNAGGGGTSGENKVPEPTADQWGFRFSADVKGLWKFAYDTNAGFRAGIQGGKNFKMELNTDGSWKITVKGTGSVFSGTVDSRADVSQVQGGGIRIGAFEAQIQARDSNTLRFSGGISVATFGGHVYRDINLREAVMSNSGIIGLGARALDPERRRQQIDDVEKCASDGCPDE